MPSVQEQLATLQQVQDAAIHAVQPKVTLPEHLSTLPEAQGDTLVICVGKAAEEMAIQAEKKLIEQLGPNGFSGIVVTKKGNLANTRVLTAITAAHPDPDNTSVAAADAIIAAVEKLKANGKCGNRILMFMSGGASALIFKPEQGLSQEAAFAAAKTLVNSGLDIVDMNIVRRVLSQLPGGGLAALAGPEIEMRTYAVSDVPPSADGRDPLEVIGSGPSVPNPTGYAEARAAIAKAKYPFPDEVVAFLGNETVPVVDAAHPTFAAGNKDFTRVIANNRMAINAAATYAREHGFVPIVLPDWIRGDAAQAAKQFAEVALTLTRTGFYNNVDYRGKRVMLFAGGEPTVKAPEGFNGDGGRANHMALQFALTMHNALPKDKIGVGNFFATDGGDGRGDQSGATTDPDTITRGLAQGLDAAQHITDCRAVYYLRATRNTKPSFISGTNVCDAAVYIPVIPPAP